MAQLKLQKTNIGSTNLNEENLTHCPQYQTYTLVMDAETEFVRN